MPVPYEAQVETIPLWTKPSDLTVGAHVVVIEEGSRPKFAGVVFVVEQLNKATVDIRPVNGGRGVRCDAYMLAPATDEQIAAAKAAPVRESFTLGETVTFKSGKAAGELLVVIKLGADVYNLVRLGGDAGRFYRSVPAAMLSAVKVTATVAE